MNIKDLTACLLLLGLNTADTISQVKNSDPVENLFTSIYKTNFWQSAESVSGPGSELRVTRRMIFELSALLKRFDITSIADAPCGDCNWMRHVDIGSCTYTGFDIVEELIERNTRLFSPTREFKYLNLIDNIIPKADLIICRDMLAHLTDEQIFKVLRNFKASGARYILATTNYATQSNSQIDKAGDWRKLNLEAAPFNFPRPLALIKEDVPFAWEEGKHLALWFLDDLNV
jgi:hypothetical protein